MSACVQALAPLPQLMLGAVSTNTRLSLGELERVDCNVWTLLDLKSNFRLIKKKKINRRTPAKQLIHQDAVMKFPTDGDPIYDGRVLTAGSCNGFLLLHNADCLWQPLRLYISNPLTGESFGFETFNTAIRFNREEESDPSEEEDDLYEEKIDHSLRVRGFGFSPMSNAYKAVGVIPVSNGAAGQVEVKVLTLGSCIWRSIGNSVYSLGYDEFSGCGIYLNGFLHWIDESIEGSRIIVAFDVEKECFQEFPLPPFCPSKSVPSNNLVLGVLKGWLSVTFRCDSKIIVWVMKHHGCNDQSWTKELEISGTDLSEKQVVEYTDEGKMFLLNEYYCSYNPRVYAPGGTKGLEILDVDRVRKVDDVRYPYRRIVETFPYIPSFVSIRDIFGFESSIPNIVPIN